MEKDQKPRVSCSIIIIRDRKILLVKEAKKGIEKTWNQPAGHLQEDEALMECAKREALEETGYKVQLIGLQKVYQRPRKKDYIINFCFRAEIREDVEKQELASDVLETGWFSKKETGDLNLRHSLTRKRINDAFESKFGPLDLLEGFSDIPRGSVEDPN